MRQVNAGILAVFFFSGATFVLPVRADEASDKAAIRRLYRVLDAAAQRGDVQKMNVYLAPDYRQRMATGQIWNRTQTMQLFQFSLSRLNMKVSPTAIHSIQIKGNRASVVSSGTATSQQRDPAGRNHIILIKSKGRDSLVKSGGVWRAYFGEQFNEEIRIDGRVVRKIDIAQTTAPPTVLDESEPENSSLIEVF